VPAQEKVRRKKHKPHSIREAVKEGVGNALAREEGVGLKGDLGRNLLLRARKKRRKSGEYQNVAYKKRKTVREGVGGDFALGNLRTKASRREKPRAKVSGIRGSLESVGKKKWHRGVTVKKERIA